MPRILTGNCRVRVSAIAPSHFRSLPAIRNFHPRIVCGFLALHLVLIGSGCNQMTSWVNNRAGSYRYNWGNYDLAKDEFQRAIANNPRNPDYYHNLAAACCRAGDDVTGEQLYQQALSVDPTHQPSYHNLALLMQRNGREAEAGQLLQGWADTQPDSEAANIELAWHRKSQGDIAGAEQALAQAMQLNPKNHIAASKLGELYQEQGRNAEALALYEKSVQRRWDQPQVQSRIAELKTANPGLMPNQTIIAQLSTPMQQRAVNLPDGTGTIESVAAYPLPQFRPNLWLDRSGMGTFQSTGTTLVSSPNASTITPTAVARPADGTVIQPASAPPSSEISDARFEAPLLKR